MAPTESQTRSRSNRLLGGVLLSVVVGTALLPWWHNREFVRSFFDYGVVMGGAGRLEAGQRPYVDFITPIQTGWYAFNWLAEKIGGGTFQAMTLSGAASIVITTLVLGGILLRRWPVWAAVIVTAAIVNATVVQHTLFWYNPWGVFLLAVVAWAGALAPVLRREDWGWHLLVAGALFLGGVNKINMHLMAFALAGGWAVRAGLSGRAGWMRVIGTSAFYALCALVLPVLAEMAWTGASFAVWWHNVIAQMVGDRAGMMLVALQPWFYLKPCHDYYGQLRLPQVGLVGVGLTLVTVIALLRHRHEGRVGLQRFLGVVCGLIALLGGVVLLTTNMDIAYIALGGWLALLVALWLGFGLPARGPWFYAGVVAPALLIGVVSWESAWRGQRSQFGYSAAQRSEYRSGDDANPVYAYLRGTRLPPDIFAGLKEIAEWRHALPMDRQARILNGPGTEWAAHIWPAPRTPELPLYILGGAQFGPKEYAATYVAINDGKFSDITVSLVLDVWMPELTTILQMKYDRIRFDGGTFYRYTRERSGGLSGAPLHFLEAFGGNTDSHALQSTGRLFRLADGRMFVGTNAGHETMKLNAPTNRLRGQVVVQRLDPKSTDPLAADFTIIAEYDEEHRFPRWEQRIELPAGQDEIIVDYAIDSSGMPTRYNVKVDPNSTGKIAAGWRGPFVYHSSREGPAQPAWLENKTGPIIKLTPAEVDRLLQNGPAWRPSEVIVRDGRMTADGLELQPGGELWIQVKGLVTDFAGIATVPADRTSGPLAMIRSMWMKDVRIEMFSRNPIQLSTHSAEFRTWSAEPNGWLILAVEKTEGAPPCTLQVTGFKHTPWP